MAPLPTLDNNPTATATANAAVAEANPGIFGGSSINSTNLQNTPHVQLPPPPSPAPGVAAANGMVAGATTASKSVGDYVAALTPPTTALDTQNQSILDSISSLTGQDAQRGTDTVAAQNAAGVTAKQQAVLDADNEIASKTASYAQMQANLGGNNSVETKAVLAAQNAGLLKAQAADIGISNAKLTAAQGNLSLANQQVTDAINLKYSTIESQIQVQQAQLAAIAPALNKQQATQAAAQQRVLQDQADAVAQKKADQTQILTTANQAATMGAPQGIVAAITNAADPATALQLATPYLAKAPTQVVEVNGHSLLIDSQTGKTVMDLGTSNSVIQANIAHQAASGGAPGGNQYTPGADPVADSWITAVKNGNATMAQVPAQYRNVVALGLSTGPAVVNSATDQQVKAIIAANPNEWGKAADAIDKAFGAGTATQYDAWLKGVYQGGKPIGEVANSESFSPLAASRLTTAANRIVTNFVDLPQYKLTAGGLPYLQRIQAAMQTPGSISDQDLLDSLTKLNTAGNAISDAQVRIITDGQSYKDMVSVLSNKFKNGGVLSDNQRQQIQTIASAIYANYQKGYQPVYDQVTKQLEAAGIPKQFWTIPDLNTLSGQGGLDNNPQVPSGNVLVTDPNGQQGYIPQSQLNDALVNGYRQLGGKY